MNGTINSDYAYIEVFIGFLERIIEMIKNLFAGVSNKETETENQ